MIPLAEKLPFKNYVNFTSCVAFKGGGTCRSPNYDKDYICNYIQVPNQKQTNTSSQFDCHVLNKYFHISRYPIVYECFAYKHMIWFPNVKSHRASEQKWQSFYLSANRIQIEFMFPKSLLPWPTSITTGTQQPLYLSLPEQSNPWICPCLNKVTPESVTAWTKYPLNPSLLKRCNPWICHCLKIAFPWISRCLSIVSPRTSRCYPRADSAAWQQ